MARPKFSLIYISRQRVVRADFSSAYSDPAVHSGPRPDAHDIDSAIEFATMLAPGLGKRVWVISTEFWTQTVELPSNRLRGMSTTDLTAALNYEAESASGTPAADAQASFRPLSLNAPGKQYYWLTQIPHATRDRIGELIRYEGGKLAGLLHPAGLPVGDGERLEYWPDVVAGVGKDTRIWNIDPIAAHRSPEIETWKREHAVSLTFLVGDGVINPGGLPSLDDEAILANWLKLWAGELNRTSTSVPSILAASEPISTGKVTALAFTMMLLVGGLCGWHWNEVRKQHQLLDTSNRASEAKVQERDQMTKMIATRKIELTKAQEERKKLETQLSQLNKHRQRSAKLMTQLASCKPDELVILAIKTQGESLVVSGLAIQPTDADQYASKLHKSLLAYGWDVQSPEQKAKNQLDSGGPWEFELVIRDLADPKPHTKTGVERND